MEVRISPHTSNRRLTISLDNEDTYFSSTERQLEGDAAPTIFRFDFRDVPVGDYTVYAELVQQIEGETKIISTKASGLFIH